MTTQRFKRYFELDPDLRRLHAKIAELRRLEALWRQALPSGLATHSAPCELLAGRLSVVAFDGVTAAKLQQMSATAINALCDLGLDVSELTVRVGFMPIPKKQPSGVPRAIGENARGTIAQTANRLADGPLKAALLRLIK